MTSTLIKAATGVSLLEVTDQLPDTTDGTMAKLIMQAMVTIATIFSLFLKNRKRKKDGEE